jgi:hypothetical protein
MIEILPPELIADVFSFLDLPSILRCKQVNHFLHDIVESAPLQYQIRLALEGQEDPGTSDMSLQVKLSALKEYASCWETLDFPNLEVITMSHGGLWELYGNVLAQSFSVPRIEFHQLKSDVRRISGDRWSLENFGFPVRDFGIDPSQELLVLVENPRWRQPPSVQESYYRFHIRHLKTGESHPQSSLKPSYVSITQHKPDPQASYSVQTSGDHFGVHVAHRSQMIPDELLIWNWKTGALHMHLIGDEIHSFAFLSESLVIAAVVHDDDPAHLRVISFDDPNPRPVKIEDSPYIISLELPILGLDAHIAEIQLRCDPSPVWRPSGPVPFSTCPENRVYTATFWVHTFESIHCCSLAIPRSTFLSHLKDIPSKRLTWHIWGPDGSRLLYLPRGHSNVWVCYVYGSRFFVPRHTASGVEIELYDFNQVAARKAITDQALGKDHAGIQVVSEPSLVGGNFNMFLQPVETRLPYRRVKKLVGRSSSTVLLSEDGIIIVRELEGKYHVMSM